MMLDSHQNVLSLVVELDGGGKRGASAKEALGSKNILEVKPYWSDWKKVEF